MKKVLSVLLVIVMISVLFMTGCNKNEPAVENHEDVTEVVFPEGVIAYVGDYEITKDDIDVYVAAITPFALQSSGNAPGWEETLTPEGITWRDAIIQSAINEACYMKAILALCNEEGIYTDEDDKLMVAEYIESNGGEEEFRAVLEETGLKEESFRRYISASNASQAYYDSICSDEDAERIFNETYITAKHILLTFEGRESEEAALEEINAVLDRINNGENFEELISELGEDPGQDPEVGYTFTEGVMVDEFYQGALNLEVGAVSEPVKTSYGYHIIKRYENPKKGTEEFDTNVYQVKNNILGAYFTDEKMNELFTMYPISVNESALSEIDLSKYTAEASEETISE